MADTETDTKARKSSEPEFIRQSANEMTEAEQGAWLSYVAREFWLAGAKHVRHSVHPRKKNLRMVEGWLEVPANEGEPRWQEADG